MACTSHFIPLHARGLHVALGATKPYAPLSTHLTAPSTTFGQTNSLRVAHHFAPVSASDRWQDYNLRFVSLIHIEVVHTQGLPIARLYHMRK